MSSAREQKRRGARVRAKGGAAKYAAAFRKLLKALEAD